MPKRKSKPKELTVFPRNSYIGRIKGTLPAFVPGRCNDLTPAERRKIELIHNNIFHLLTEMEKK